MLDGGIIDLGLINWTTNAFPLRTLNAPEVRGQCPAGGTTYPAWGTDVYTDDSSLCTAAAHAGILTPLAGGAFAFQFAPGLVRYIGTTRNGVYSASWPHAHPRSICFGGVCTPPSSVADAGVITWNTTAASFGLSEAEQADAVCPPGNAINSIWGTVKYTTDSPVCVAAVHDGRITAGTGGSVRIVIVAGQPSYASSTQNGVTSSSWGAFAQSYSFLP